MIKNFKISERINTFYQNIQCTSEIKKLLEKILSKYKSYVILVLDAKGGALMDEISRLQNVLLLVRRSVGWTAEEFGNRIGVTRQTINNLESGRNNLTKTQYIAMRSILDAEIAKFPDETQMLHFILDAFVDHPEKYSKEDKEKILNKANLLAPAILAETSSRKDVSKEWVSTIVRIGVITFAAVAALKQNRPNTPSEWLSKIISEKGSK